MARKQHSELMAGIFTIFATALLVGVVFWLGGLDIFQPAASKAWFFVKFDRGLQGLQPGAQVKITDVEVGKISVVELDRDAGGTYYLVELFDARTKIYSNARASVSAALVGGGATLQILHCGGGDKAKLADRNNPAKIELGMLDKAKTVVDKIDKKFDSIGKQVTDLLKDISDQMNQAEPNSAMHKLHATMDVLEATLASVRKELDAGNKLAVIAKIHQTIGSLQRIASDAEPKVSSMLTTMDKMVKATEPKVAKLLTGAGDLVDNLNKLTKEDITKILKLIHTASEHVVKIGGDFAKLSGGVGAMMSVNRENIDEMIDNMGQVASNLKSASKEIRRNPWRLLYRPKKEEERSRNIHDAARSFSDGASQLDQALAKLKGLAAAHPDGIPADDPQLKNIAEQIKNTFEKFTDAEKALWKELLK
ncbi:MAG: MlaD family protein [Phycisphaerae bacterium]|jgi:ABC-type transporter Mla subunit MlaD|nr:MlaD family protein [Phycisphaerae bacterium]